MAPQVRAVCDDLVDRVCELGECDVVSDLAEPLPLIVQLLTGGVVAEPADALKVNACVDPAGATLVIVRKPLFGAKTQSDGSEFGWPEG